METQEFVARLSLAFGAGLVIGLERQIHQKSAGLRTNTLVAVGAAVFVLLSINITEGSENADVTRIIGQVVTGIGFLGAGIIFKEGFNIHGLTTAATVWCSSAVGCCAAAGLYTETIISTVFILMINLLRFPIGWLFKKNDKQQ